VESSRDWTVRWDRRGPETMRLLRGSAIIHNHRLETAEGVFESTRLQKEIAIAQEWPPANHCGATSIVGGGGSR